MIQDKFIWKMKMKTLKTINFFHNTYIRDKFNVNKWPLQLSKWPIYAISWLAYIYKETRWFIKDFFTISLWRMQLISTAINRSQQ